MDENRKHKARSTLHPDLVATIGHYVIDKGWTNAAGLHRQLMEDLRDRPLGTELPEDPRTIRTWVRKFQSQDSSGIWTLANAEDTNPAAVMAVLAEILEDPDPQATTLTVREAQIISALYGVENDIPPLEALSLARRYILRESRDQPTDGLDRYVALRGWTLAPEHYEALRRRGLFDGVDKVFALAEPATGTGTAHNATVIVSEGDAQ